MGLGNWVVASCVVVSLLSSNAEGSLEAWAWRTKGVSRAKLLANISPAGTLPGTVVASPSRSNPDYWYHWIRDAALVMDVIVGFYENAGSHEKSHYENMLMDYIHLSRRNQTTPNPSGFFALGEPKFHVDGSAFEGSWGRPQNDGPALRAIALTRLAHRWIEEGKANLVHEKLYRAEIPAHTVIKADLEYVSHHWRQSNFDLWEEVRGQHFYTRMVQRKALKEGGWLARRLGDHAAADWYFSQADELEREIQKHFDPHYNFVRATLDRDGGADYKHSGLDAAVILGALHGDTHDGFFGPTSPAIWATAAKLEDAFKQIYAVNQKGYRGVAIGRYPEDLYDGYSTGGGGNPWFICTNALAEMYYKAASRSFDLGRARYFRGKGDDFLSVSEFHGAADGSFSEQMNRWTGFMQGAHDLTWSYASVLTAIEAR